MCGCYDMTAEDQDELEGCLNTIEAYIVSRAVGNVRNNNPDLIQPASLF